MSISENLPVVRGAECLQYINKPIGFKYNFFKDERGNLSSGSDAERNIKITNTPMIMHGASDTYFRDYLYFNSTQFNYECCCFVSTITRWYHNPNKRVIGLIRDSSDDGGIHITILGQNEIIRDRLEYSGNDILIGSCDYTTTNLNVSGKFQYERRAPSPDSNWIRQTEPIAYAPQYPVRFSQGGESGGNGCILCKNNNNTQPYGDESYVATYDECNNYIPTFVGAMTGGFYYPFEYEHQEANNIQYTITNDPDHTLDFGVIATPIAFDMYYPNILIDYPTCNIAGNMYKYAGDMTHNYSSMLPYEIPYDIEPYDFKSPASDCVQVFRPNKTSIPFNLILTTDYGNAINYLQNGTLPFDAKLYPLDWENLPTYDVPSPEVDPDDPEPDDTPDDTIVDPTPDDVVDVDPDVDPTTTVQNLCNYNLYWLQADQWQGFINWFWHDISAWSGFDDLINSIQGLYNDLGSAVIMCRYMPVKAQWIGGLGDDENIKLGMIEKTGNVNTISKRAVPIRRDLGEITINQIVSNNFLDFSPYSQLSLYLPLHGFVDLDMNIFQGHKNDYKKLIIQGIYDLLSGTLQYLIYVKPNGKDKALVNSFVVKIAQDIPLTLQTKNDRDSMIFGNVASTVGGLLGAGASIATGNPIGIAMGSMNAVNTLASAGSKSAPMSVKGTTGEMGGLYAPERPMIILRRAAVQPSDSYEDSDKRLDTWKSRVGRLSGYGQPMGSINGYVQLAQPRIKFTHNIPLQSEIDELYQILQQGFVCSTKS